MKIGTVEEPLQIVLIQKEEDNVHKIQKIKLKEINHGKDRMGSERKFEKLLITTKKQIKEKLN